MKRTLVVAALAAATMGLTPAANAASIDWKPGLTQVSDSAQSRGWKLGYTYRWASGRAPSGAYVVELRQTVFRMTWTRDSDPECDTWWQDRLVAHGKFTTTVQEANGNHVWNLGLRRIACPHDGVAVVSVRYASDKSPNMYYTRTGAAPVIKTHIAEDVDDWPDPDWHFTDKMLWRGRSLPLPW